MEQFVEEFKEARRKINRIEKMKKDVGIDKLNELGSTLKEMKIYFGQQQDSATKLIWSKIVENIIHNFNLPIDLTDQNISDNPPLTYQILKSHLKMGYKLATKA